MVTEMFPSDVEFISAGGNRHPNVADWDREGTDILAFGAGQNVALWKPREGEHRGIRALLPGHTGDVHAVKFLSTRNARTTLLISGSVDHTIRIWAANWGETNDIRLAFQERAVLTEHTKTVNSIATLADRKIFASGAADGKVIIWQTEFDDEISSIAVQVLQCIVIAPKLLPLALALTNINISRSIVLAIAGTGNKVQVHVAKSESENFTHIATLTGHENWIRSLVFTHESKTADGDLLLASASQDKYIRLWRLSQNKPALASADTDLDLEASTIETVLSNRSYAFEVDDHDYTITFEALLLGHEDWIYSTSWHHTHSKLQLLSASADNSLAIWELDPSSGVWICTVRLGEISSQKGATTATGSSGGFWAGLWSPCGEAVVSLGGTGSWRLWHYDALDGRWTHGVGVSGHTSSVKSIAWTSDGSLLLSTSSDQTTRLYAKWLNGTQTTWHEFSRPQIHGYDLNCIDAIGTSMFISGADEKLLRVFTEPRAVADCLLHMCGIKTTATEALPDAASIPVLGLSNKAVLEIPESLNSNREVDNEEEDQHKENSGNDSSSITKSHASMSLPPSEDQLARHLLWPEIEKLYGHGYEISAVSASHDGTVIATACLASSVDHAVIRLYETTTWHELKPALVAHSLTVTGLEFSADDTYLLSVSRDRQCTVFKRSPTDDKIYEILAINNKAHQRMILGASWAPLEVGPVFATAGRDKVVNVWKVLGNDIQRQSTLTFSKAVTAIDFLPQTVKQQLILTSALEDGNIHLSTLTKDDLQLENGPYTCSKMLAPSASVTGLRWRPCFEDRTEQPGEKESTHDSQLYTLAACSNDSSVRILNVSFPLD